MSSDTEGKSMATEIRVDDPMRFSKPTSLEVSTARAWLSAYAARTDLHHHTGSELLSMAYVVAAFSHWQTEKLNVLEQDVAK